MSAVHGTPAVVGGAKVTVPLGVRWSCCSSDGGGLVKVTPSGSMLCPWVSISGGDAIPANVRPVGPAACTINGSSTIDTSSAMMAEHGRMDCCWRLFFRGFIRPVDQAPNQFRHTGVEVACGLAQRLKPLTR